MSVTPAAPHRDGAPEGRTWLLDPHHDGSEQYLSPGPFAIGDVAVARVHVPHTASRRGQDVPVRARWLRDGEPAWSAGQVESVDRTGAWFVVQLPIESPVTRYRFLLGAGGVDDYRWLNAAGCHTHDVPDAEDFRLSTFGGPPDWVLDQVVYQVFPDRFARGGEHPTPSWGHRVDWQAPVDHRPATASTQWYGGDLDGVVDHLDHLESLGVTLLYLTPVFEGRSNHRYDAVSFDRVDPLLGGDEALGRLVDALHARGMRIVGDLTLNHTGSGHEWFVRAQRDADCPEAAFYSFIDHPDRYETWWGVPTLPKLDHHSAELARRLYSGPESVVGRWLRAGLDGWRIDVANMTGRLRETDLNREVARAVRATFDTLGLGGTDGAWLLAEHGHDASADLLGDGWHGTMDYSGFMRPVWAWLNGGSAAGPGRAHGLTFLGAPVQVPVIPADDAVTTIRQMHAAAGWRAWTASTAHLDTHDTPRFRTVVGGGCDGGVDLAGDGRERHLLGIALQLTLPGVPAVFAGDELGLTGVDGEHSRTPFPWSAPETWDDETLHAYRTWIRLRRAHVALRRGGLRWVQADDESMTFLREHPRERLMVHVARGGEMTRVPREPLGLTVPSDLKVLVGVAPTWHRDEILIPAGVGAHMYALPSTSADRS